MSMAVGGAGMPKVRSGASAKMQGTSNVHQRHHQNTRSLGSTPSQTLSSSLDALNALVKSGPDEKTGQLVNKYV